tara:strand:- start:1473 stop:1691 length:219 start_codon:yes stop_codon:yes gene_type:complete
MTEMFPDMEETLSPRQKWIRNNAVKSFELEGEDGKYKAVSGDFSAIGDDEDQAILRLAQTLWIRKQIKTWEM